MPALARPARAMLSTFSCCSLGVSAGRLPSLSEPSFYISEMPLRDTEQTHERIHEKHSASTWHLAKARPPSLP